MPKEKKLIPTAISLKNVGSLEVFGNTFLGDARMVDGENVGSVSINSNTYMTTDAYRIFSQFKHAISAVQNDLPEDVVRELNQKIKILEANQGSPSFLVAYNSLIASLASHAAVIEPVMHLFQPYIDYLSNLI